MRSMPARGIANAAVAAIVAFVSNVALLPLAQQGSYNPLHQTISELALGRAGWLQDAAFCVLAVGTACLAVTLRRQVSTARFAPLALAAAAALDVVSAMFHAVRMGTPATTASQVHVGAGICTFILTIAAMYGLVRPFQRTGPWASFARPTLVWALVATVGMLTLGPPSTGYYFGVGQRVMASTFMSWMLVTALKARRRAGEQAAMTAALNPVPRRAVSA